MPVPHEVPLGPQVFVNRHQDFARMDEFWVRRRAGAARISICSGLPGVGKTAFVRRCVQQVRDMGAFPGGDLHVDFGSLDGARPSVADALASCLGALGVAKEVIPDSLSERANRLRSITADKPVLIVLEDVTDPAQVQPFLPNSQSSVVLVTSSGKLSELVLDGADQIRLNPLDGEDGVHLLRELMSPGSDTRLDAEPNAVTELVRLCAGLPVVLKVAAARLIARPELSVQALATEIGDDDRGLAAFTIRGQAKVSSVFFAAYEALDRESARLYRLMGVAPGHDLAQDDAAVLADLSTSAVRRSVETLDDAGLLNVDAAQRLSLHPMVRRHAAHLADSYDPPAEQAAAIRRLVRHRLVKMAFADQAILGPDRYRCTPPELTRNRPSPFAGPDGKAAAVEWCTMERVNLLATQRTAAQLGWHDETWQLAEALTALYVTRRYLVDWTVSSALGAESAHHVGNSRAEARLRSFVSRAWTDLGRLDRAKEELLVNAQPMAEATADTRLRASVWELVGRLRDEIAPQYAADAYEQAIELFTSADDDRGVAFTMFFLGHSHHRFGRLDLAEATLRASLPRIRAVPDDRMEGRCLAELGAVLLRTGRREEARQELHGAIELLRRGNFPYYEALAQETLLATVEAQDDQSATRMVLARLTDLHQAIGSGRAEEFSARLDRLPPR